MRGCDALPGRARGTPRRDCADVRCADARQVRHTELAAQRRRDVASVLAPAAALDALAAAAAEWGRLLAAARGNAAAAAAPLLRIAA
jgi:hypothetical protein